MGKISWRRKQQTTPVFLPREFHGERSLAGYSPWDHKESDMTELITFTSKVVKGVPKVLLVAKNPPANAGDARDSGLIAGLGRSPEVGNSNPLARKTPWMRSMEGYSPWG